MAEDKSGPAAPQKAYMGKRGAGKFRDMYRAPLPKKGSKNAK